MESKRRIILVLIMATVVILASLPCSLAQDSNDRNTRADEGSRMERPGQRSGERNGRRGPGRGRPRMGRPDGRWRRPELTDEQIDRVLEGLKQRDPNTAKELADLRKKDPNEFRTELRRSAGPEIGRVIIDSWRERRREEFLDWLEKNVLKEAEALAQLKDNDPNLYAQKYELTWRKYGRTYDRSRGNPELAQVLVADLQLSEREDELLKKIKAAKAEEEKSEIMAQLEEVVSDKYDLIVRRKQIEYEELLRRLQELQNRVKASIEDIGKWRNQKFKEEKVKERVKDLTEKGEPRFRWD